VTQSAAHHSALVESVNPNTGVLSVLEQDVNGVVRVVHDAFNAHQMTNGVLTVYRPSRC
jgi:hypothetical protein